MTAWKNVTTPVLIDAHKTPHQDGGADQVSVTGLSGLLADDQHVLDAEVSAVAVAHSLATAINDFLVASGAGAFVKKTLAETLTILGKAVASGLASLDPVGVLTPLILKMARNRVKRGVTKAEQVVDEKIKTGNY